MNSYLSLFSKIEFLILFIVVFYFAISGAILWWGCIQVKQPMNIWKGVYFTHSLNGTVVRFSGNWWNELLFLYSGEWLLFLLTLGHHKIIVKPALSQTITVSPYRIASLWFGLF